MRKFVQCCFQFAVLIFAFFLSTNAHTAESLDWNTNANRVSAEMQSVPLLRLLEDVTEATGWKVYIESNTTHTVSTKFKNVPMGEALHLLLGDLNYALTLETNSGPHLYIFRTSQANANQLVVS